MKRVVVVGCGVIGLTTSLRLLEDGYEVTIVTKELPGKTTSNKAAAFWFPYHVRDSKEILRWSMLSYAKFESLSKNPASGVSMTPAIKLGDHVSEIEQRIHETMPLEKFRSLHHAELRGSFKSGWYIEVPLIETPIYLPFLMNQFISKGGKVSLLEVHSLDELIPDDAIVINCTGLGSRELANDSELIPVRGQVAFLKTENRHRIILEDTSPTYIVYRTDGCICGGTYEENIFLNETEDTTIKAILDRCYDLEPQLRESELIDTWAGLRPYRPNIRVEQEENKPLIHNYGHGGSGFTVSWGCAEEVVRIVKSIQ